MTDDPIFGAHAHEYRHLGYSPLPVPRGQKSEPPRGWTGYGAPYASQWDVQAWCEDKALWNVALRLPDGVLGLDVDAYEGKLGEQTMLDAIKRHGRLPSTVMITSRADGVSGIRLFRVPLGRAWADELGTGVELIHHGHRYVMGPGSLHPEGGTYRCLWTMTRQQCGLLAAEELPELPAMYVRELDRGSVDERGAKIELDDAEVKSFVESMSSRQPSRYLQGLLAEAQNDLGAGGSRHNITRQLVLKIVRAGEQGQAGARTAFDTAQNMFATAVAGERGRDLAGEWSRLVVGAVALVKANPTVADDRSDVVSTSAHQAVEPRTLDETHATFTRWLGDEYDLDVLDVVLSVAASERLGGDPAWLLVVSGSGAAKTETVAALAGAGALVTSTISSEAALLSGSAKRERTKQSTGGLLRKLGDDGVLVIKDVSSILSMHREARGLVLHALREVYDGFWERNLGVDGGRSLPWRGRIVLIGAVTTAWDNAHSVVAAMGDRFLLVRFDSSTGRVGAGRQAIGNTGSELTMRDELKSVVGGVLSTVDGSSEHLLNPEEVERLLSLADIVTLARTAVERDFRGDVIDAHAPEMPTRFAKQLTQVARGARSLGIDRERAMRLATRCAADSMPPLRLLVLLYVKDNPHASTHAVRVSLDRPRATIDRELQALHTLGLVTVDEIVQPSGKTAWYYTLSEPAHIEALALLGSARFVVVRAHDTRRERASEPDSRSSGPLSDRPGTSPQCRRCGQALLYPASIESGLCARCETKEAS